MTMELAAPQRKLPVRAAAWRAWQLVWELRGAVWRLAGIPTTILVVILTGIGTWVAIEVQKIVPTEQPSADFLLILVVVFVGNILWILMNFGIAVSVHRAMLLNEPPGTFKDFPWSGAFSYLGTSILISFAVLPVYVVLIIGISMSRSAPLVGLLLIGLGLIGAAIVSVRLCLLLPARAIRNTEFGFRASWRATGKNTLRILAGSILVGLPFIAFNVLLSVLIGLLFGFDAQRRLELMTSGDIGFVLVQIILAPLQFLMVCAFAVAGPAFLSLTYDALVRGGGPQSDPA